MFSCSDLFFSNQITKFNTYFAQCKVLYYNTSYHNRIFFCIEILCGHAFHETLHLWNSTILWQWSRLSHELLYILCVWCAVSRNIYYVHIWVCALQCYVHLFIYCSIFLVTKYSWSTDKSQTLVDYCSQLIAQTLSNDIMTIIITCLCLQSRSFLSRCVRRFHDFRRKHSSFFYTSPKKMNLLGDVY